MQQITHPGEAEQTINKSRFIAFAQYCPDERAIALLLRQIATRHGHAHHLAYAFRLKGPQGIVQRFSDAGEPSGTAGMPILQHLEGRDLVNACVAVVRYYGGINLGTGGLVRAYGGTAKLALDAARLSPYVETQRLRLSLPYNRLDAFVREVQKLGGEILDKQFGAQIEVEARVPAADASALLQRYGG